MKKQIGALLFLAFVVLPAFAEMPADTTKRFTSPSWVAFRSALIPGWGQFYNDKIIKGLVVAGGQLGMGYGIYRQNTLYHKNANLSKDAFAAMIAHHGTNQSVGDSLDAVDYDQIARFYQDDRNKLIWWSAGAMLLSVFDAFVDAHLRHFDVGPTIGADGEPKVEIIVRW